ncbi:MAG: DUF1289 domain-containing protein [Limnohabitans sp.]
MTLDPRTIANRRWRRVAEMAQQAVDGPHVPSPCQSVCVMHPGTGWCEGCLRTLDEIAAWGRMDDAARRAVWVLLPERLGQRMALEAAE